MPPLLRERRRAVLFAVLIASGFAQAGLAIGSAKLMDSILTTLGTGSKNSDPTPFLMLILAGFALFMLRAWQRRDSEALGLSYIQDVRLSLFSHACNLPMSVRGPSLGPMLARLTNDLLAIKNWVSYGVAGGIVALTTVATSLTYLVVLEPAFALASAAVMSLMAVTALLLVSRLEKSVRSARKERGKLAKALGSKLPARHTIQLLGRSDRELHQVRRISNDLTASLTQRGLWSGFLRATPFAVLPLAVCMMPFATTVTSHIGSGPVSPPSTSTIVTWLFVMGLAVAQLQEAARALDYWVNFKPAMKRIRSTFELKVLAPTPDGPRAPKGNDLTIRLSEFGSGENAARSSEFSMPSGSRALLTGSSPDRRSEILRAIARLDFAEGIDVAIDGIDISAVSLPAYRRLVTLVNMELPFMAGTLGGNLRKAAGRNFSKDQTASALRVVGLLPRDRDLDAVLATPVMDNGTFARPYFSARARLAVALVRQPRIVLLDDPEALKLGDPISKFLDHCRANQVSVLISSDGYSMRDIVDLEFGLHRTDASLN